MAIIESNVDVNSSTTYCPRVIRDSQHIPLLTKTAWSWEIFKVTVGIIHTNAEETPKSLLSFTPSRWQTINPTALPSSLLYPAQAWECFYAVRHGMLSTVDYLSVSVDINLKGGRVIGAEKPEVVYSGLIGNLERVCEVMRKMPKVLPRLEVSIDVSYTPSQYATKLCYFVARLIMGIARLNRQQKRHDGWYDISIEISLLKMSKCGITAQHLTHPLRIDPSWFPTTSPSLVVARWDLYDNAIRSEDAMLDDIQAPSLFTTLISVCKSITEIDVNGNPPGCNELFLPFNGAKIIHNILQQNLPDHHHPVQKRPPPPHHRRSAGEWEVILTRLLSSIINDALNKVSGRRMKDRKPYIRVFGSALSGFSLSSEESDVDAVVLLEGEEKFSEGILEEGSSSPWYGLSRAFVRSLGRILPSQTSIYSRQTSCIYSIKLMESIPEARVPIVKLKLMISNNSMEEKVEVDLSFMNPLGVKNSELLREYGKLHPCVIPVVCAVKAWAKQKGLVSAKENNFQRLTSYAWTMMVIFYLQVRVGLLPSLQRPSFATYDPSQSPTFFINADDDDLKMAISKGKVCPNYNNYRSEDADKLTRGFFNFYGLGEFLYLTPVDITRGAISPQPTPEQRREIREALRTNRFKPKLVIRDPFLRNKNLASNCSHWNVVYRAIRDVSLTHR